MNKAELYNLKAKIQLFRCAYRQMDIDAQEALISASALGLYDEATSDMFGDGTRDGILNNHTNKIQAIIDGIKDEP